MSSLSADAFGREKVSRILLRLAPPVMFAQLIQALYNIVDSLFIGRYAPEGLTALSIVYPLQLLMIALAVGTGVGINTVMAAKLGVGEKEESARYAGLALPLSLLLWLVFAVLSWILLPAFAAVSTDSPLVADYVVRYGRIVCAGSLGLFLESVWTKVLQAEGNMKRPMLAQITGALVNIALDPLLIFGWGPFPSLGMTGAALATAAGQFVAALFVMRGGLRPAPPFSEYRLRFKRIFKLGLPNILMQSAYTFYILGLNLILASFCDEAVTALGLYYKWQTFFFIPLGAMQTCIVPVVSYNYAAGRIERCRETLKASLFFGLALMAVGTLCFEIIPGPLLKTFTADPRVIEIGLRGFRFIGVSFLPMVTSLIFPVFFQAVGSSLKSSALTVVRTVVLFVPLGYLFSRFGLDWFWLTFFLTESLTTLLGFAFYRRFLEHPYVQSKENQAAPAAAELLPSESAHTPLIRPSHPGVIITIAREHGSGGKQIGRIVADRLNIPFYYKEMTALAAHESGLDREFISDVNRNAPKLLHDLYLSTHVVQQAVIAQAKIIKKIAKSGSCVIVGRAADYVLRDEPKLLRVFIAAPSSFKISRLEEVYGDSAKAARRNMKKSDRARAKYYAHISGRKWGEKSNYDLVLDASEGPEACVARILTKAASL